MPRDSLRPCMPPSSRPPTRPCILPLRPVFLFPCSPRPFSALLPANSPVLPRPSLLCPPSTLLPASYASLRLVSAVGRAHTVAPSWHATRCDTPTAPTPSPASQAAASVSAYRHRGAAAVCGPGGAGAAGVCMHGERGGLGLGHGAGVQGAESSKGSRDSRVGMTCADGGRWRGGAGGPRGLLLLLASHTRAAPRLRCKC